MIDLNNLNYYKLLTDLDEMLIANEITNSRYNELVKKTLTEINESGNEEFKNQLNKYLIDTEQKLDDSGLILLSETEYKYRGTNGDQINLRVDGPGQSDRNFDKMPYFKIYTGNHYRYDSKSNGYKESRITMTEIPQYLKHDGYLWYLNNSELKLLYKFLSEKDPELEGDIRWMKLYNKALTFAINKDTMIANMSKTVPNFYAYLKK